MISLHLIHLQQYFSSTTRKLTILFPSPLIATPMNLNISPSPFDIEPMNEDQDHNPNFSCQVFFDSTDRDRTKFYNHHQFYQPHHHPEDDCYSYHGESSYDNDTNNKVDDDLRLTLWSDPVKWKPSRVEPIQEKKMNPEEDRVTIKLNTSACRNKVRDQDQKLQPSSSLEADLSSNSSRNIVNNSPTIRVCSDCNTTKTPLWRSGPKGPKSLCNACGIRQRKARRAMAAAAAAAAATGMPASADPPPPILKIKVQQQNKQKIRKFGHGQDSKFKKRSKITATAAGSSSSSNGPKKLNFEDFLIKLSKNLAFQRVFPQDEKDAAILLMALSSGLVHG